MKELPMSIKLEILDKAKRDVEAAPTDAHKVAIMQRANYKLNKLNGQTKTIEELEQEIDTHIDGVNTDIPLDKALLTCNIGTFIAQHLTASHITVEEAQQLINTYIG